MAAESKTESELILEAGPSETHAAEDPDVIRDDNGILRPTCHPDASIITENRDGDVRAVCTGEDCSSDLGSAGAILFG